MPRPSPRDPDNADPWKTWRHITKLDPDKRNNEAMIRGVVKSGTDAIMVSGTQGITKEKVDNLLGMLKGCDVPIVLEPASKDVVNMTVDYLFIPLVLNSGKKWWTIDAHCDWLDKCIEDKVPLDWRYIVAEGYIVLNERSAVARVTKSRTKLTESEVLAYATLADRLLRIPIVYIEYSGTYGDPDLVRSVKNKLKNATLFYGGGIDSREKALEMSRYATIIVGNVVYDNFDKFLETII